MRTTYPSNRRQRRRHHQAGNTMLETALVLMTLAGMILFMLDMGRILMTRQLIVDRARATARAAAVNGWDATSAANFAVYGSTSAPAQQNNVTPPGLLGLVASQVSLSVTPDSGIGDGRYTVTIQNVQLSIYIPGIAGSYTMPAVTVSYPAPPSSGF